MTKKPTRREAIRPKAPPSPYAPIPRAFEAKLPSVSEKQPFYETDAWRDIRYRALSRSNGKCDLCGSSKHDGAILHVHHIKPRSRFPELELSLDNLQVLCADCNLGKSNRDTRDWRTRPWTRSAAASSSMRPNTLIFHTTKD